MIETREILRVAVEMNASDIFVVAGGPVHIKVDGKICALNDDRVMPDGTEHIIEDLYEMANRPMNKYREDGDDDFSFAVSGLARFRVNTYKQRNSMAAVIRVVVFSVPNAADIHIPERVMELSELKSGMILITGTAGSGKSTTSTCLIDRINNTREAHIITMEDPIEFLHRNNLSIVSQREISIDTKNYLTALRASLREAPDVIFLGEMRDYETIRTAMTAAETGHLVIATLHTRNVVNSVDRIIDSFPAEQQGQIKIQLSMVLAAVVSQQLLRSESGGLIPAFEIMIANSAIRNMIRESKTYQIDNAILSGRPEGMISMDTSILELYNKGIISAERAINAAINKEQMKRKVQG